MRCLSVFFAKGFSFARFCQTPQTNAPSPCYTLLRQVNGSELLQGNRYSLQTCPGTVSVAEQLAEIIDSNVGWRF